MSKKFIEAGFPAPNQYDDWRSWAAAFLGALDGLSGEDITNLPLYVRKEGETREGLPVGAEGDLIRVRDEDGKNRLYVYEDGEGWKSTQEASADSDLGNIPENIDYVVDSKIATEEDPSWYRVYKSGWVEQGGRILYTTQNFQTSVTYLVPFADINYSVTSGAVYDHGTSSDRYGSSMLNVVGRTATGATFAYWIDTRDNNNTYFIWEAKGQGASQ